MPWIACVSMFHSTLPLVSEKSPFAGVCTTCTGTCGKPFSLSNWCRSLMTVSVAPLPRIATEALLPISLGGSW
jgi:hypothetical protein